MDSFKGLIIRPASSKMTEAQRAFFAVDGHETL
jgi:hypothetical protein